MCCGFEANRPVNARLKEALIRFYGMIIGVCASIESIHGICEEEGLLFRAAKAIWVCSQPEVKATRATLWGTAENDIGKKGFVHARKIVRLEARPWSIEVL